MNATQAPALPTNRRLRVLVVMGTRPEAIKMVPVVRALQARPEAFDVRVCATAQHREMLDQVLELFAIVPAVICCDVELRTQSEGTTCNPSHFPPRK